MSYEKKNNRLWFFNLILFTVSFNSFLLLFSGPVFSSSLQIPSLSNPNMSKVSENVYALIGDMDIPNEHNDGFICNSVFIVTNKSVIVIDPGGSKQIGEMIIRQIRRVTNNPITHVFNTHHHADHWMGNHAFSLLEPKPKIISHKIMHDSAIEIGERWVKIIADLTKGKNQDTKLIYPSKFVDGTELLKIDNVELQLIHPNHAHTKGDIVIYLPQEKVLIPGDVLFYIRTPGFQDASPMGNLQSLIDLNRLNFSKVVPGHGPVTDKSGMDYMINYVKLLHNEVKKYFDEGLSDFEMKDKIDIGNYSTMSGFNSRFGINVNRMYLEVEALSFEE